MKIYQKTKFHQSGNVVVCIMTAKVNIFCMSFNAGSVRGIARCAPEDQFDLKKGQMITESKATQKMYNRISSTLSKALKETYKELEYLKNELNRIADLQDTEEQHFEEICQ